MYKQIKKLSSREMKSFFQGYTVSKKKELDFWLKAYADLLQLYYFLREVIWMQGVFFVFWSTMRVQAEMAAS